jgi:hypothetical protein
VDRNVVTGRRIAALVRTHLPRSAKALDLARRLQEAGFAEVLFVADETRGPIDAGGFVKLPHTLDSIAAMGLPIGAGKRTLWFSGDYAFYASVLGRSSADFFLMIEYDVGLRDPSWNWWRRLRGVLERPRLANLDMTGAYLGPYVSGHFASDYRRPHKALFAVTGLSARAIETLYAARLREAARGAPDERGTHCEVFVPSELIRARGFFCLDLNRVLPGAADRAAFSNTIICPFGHEDLLDSECALAHRVVDMEEYLEKSPYVVARAESVPTYRRHLQILGRRGVPAERLEQAAALAQQEADRLARRVTAPAIGSHAGVHESG